MGRLRGGRKEHIWIDTRLTSNAAAGPFSTQPSGPRPVGCFSSAAADRPVWIQIWALYRQSGSDRLEKQPTDLRRHHHYMRDGTLNLDVRFRSLNLQGFPCGADYPGQVVN